ncbi:MAG: pyruvate:ferredoxin (flavodoxin) oxidoreductase [Lactobacillales bacterium]|jgi:pyruvate-ferredoxin/flavodoxin oxidoreductase|nr:pyruvate:ferredoxin (flavodoxin) oxidoreductase [Lactobacillales bacterium]
MTVKQKMLDAGEACAAVAYKLNEMSIIYPITPSSPMGEWADAWASEGVKNIWGKVPQVLEMQSEGGAIGAVHGSLQTGTMTTTYTASQGLLLMIPNMFKIAGELTPFVMHVTARTIAGHALSIFGDHSDVMACRQTGFAFLASNSVQEAQDFAAIAQMSTFLTRIPFLHFFDGFRTSHEINKIDLISETQLKELMKDIPTDFLSKNALKPEDPKVRGTAQNPDVFFQIKEAANKYYKACPDLVDRCMRTFERVTGRAYHLVDYVGAKDAEHVIVAMGSGAETIEETVKALNARGGKYGCVIVRLYRPFPNKAFIDALPKSVRQITVLDRTKESGSVGEPLYLDVVSSVAEAMGQKQIDTMPKVLGGRYGLSSKEFTPAMVKAIFENADKNHFTIGIEDDVTHLSLPYDPSFGIESDDVSRCVFFGLGADGTVGANKNSIKIIAEDGGYYGQGYFVYDSKKSGAMTVSHLRFSKTPIRAPYLITSASFVACHHTPFIYKMDILALASKNAVFLLNTPEAPENVWNSLPIEMQQEIIDKNIKLYAIDAVGVAEATGMGRRINTIMQTCFFAISGVLPKDDAIAKIKQSIEKTYARKGQEIVDANIKAVDATLAHLHEIKTGTADSKLKRQAGIPSYAPKILQDVTGKIIEGKGDLLPVSAFEWTVDGTWPTDTAKYEKRRIATEIPTWDPALCIQCGKCVAVCPHAAIRAKVFGNDKLADAPAGFKCTDYKGKEFPDSKFVIQVAPEDCTGCTLCAGVCPGRSRENPAIKSLMMEPIEKHLDQEIKNFDFFMALPDADRTKLSPKQIKSVGLMRPLFEFSGACAGCGETPYIKMVTQLYGDRSVIANATGCSSIYGGNLPTTPYAKNAAGQGPAWANSLFEDNAEFGIGMRTSIDSKADFARQLLGELSADIGTELVTALQSADQSTEQGIEDQRRRVLELKKKLAGKTDEKSKLLMDHADYLVKKSVWIFGGDGWAYDIDYGGLDHVFYSGKNVNIMVMDTGVYSNTGGQRSKATPLGASAKFAITGNALPRKDLGVLAMMAGNIYVASIALGAKDMHTLQVINEAESFDGPSLIIAYSHCIAHGYDIGKHGLEHQKMAVDTGLWPLYRFDPRRKAEGLNPFQLDSKPTKTIAEFMDTETRFKFSKQQNPQNYEALVKTAQEQVNNRIKLYEKLAGGDCF